MILQRPNPPGSHDDVITDFVMFDCPIRKRRTFALQDNIGEWWSSPNWRHYGKLLLYKEGETRAINKWLFVYSDTDATPLDNMYPQILDGIRLVNQDGWSIYQRYHPEDEKGYWPGAAVDGVEVPVFPNNDWVKENCALYAKCFEDRSTWEADFERIYPRPKGALLSAHELSVKAAKARHAIACRAKASRLKRREKGYADMVD